MYDTYSLFQSVRQMLCIVVLLAAIASLSLSGNLLGQTGCAYPCPYQEAGPVNYCEYPGSGCPPNYHPENGCCCYDYSPIVVDVIGNGFDLTSSADGVVFDFSGKGKPVQIAWTARGSDDAWLVLDRNANGRIDDATEMFGNATPQQVSLEPNGFAALAEFDKPGQGGNMDGVIDAGDSIYRSLRLWQDSNHNGVSEPGELHSLASLGVTGIGLKYHESRRVDEYGNSFRYRAKVYRDKDGNSSRWAWDVFLRVGGNQPVVLSSATGAH